MISILTASRRPEGYKKLVEQLEQSSIAELIENYIVMVDNEAQHDEFKSIKDTYSKVKIMKVQHNYIYNNGWDAVYNILAKAAKTPYVWLLFDTDIVKIDGEQFKKDMEQQADVYSYPTYMQRGDAQETKAQLYKKDCLEWFGALHENQMFKRQPKVADITSANVSHNNALDAESKNIRKSSDGFLLLDKTQEGTDSDKRNLLYEGITWKIVHGEFKHQHMGWFQRHYELNKEVIDWYHDRAEQIYNGR